MPKILSPVFPPRRVSGYVRYALVFILVAFIYYSFGPGASSSSDAELSRYQTDDGPYFNSFPPNDGTSSPDHESPSPKGSTSAAGNKETHPIDKLIFEAQREFAALVSKEAKTLEEAARAYRNRRGRHPPPGFDTWYKFASSNNAVIIEDFFDQIYHDLHPFWAMDPALLRKEAASFEMTIHIRNKNATTKSDWFWTKLWLDMIQTVAPMLPDMDLALNPMDEPRLIVPWADVQDFVRNATKTIKLPKAKKVVSDFQDLPDPSKVEPSIKIEEKKWKTDKPYWPLVREGCAPNSLAQTTPIQKDFSKPPSIDMSKAGPHSYKGYVANYTHSTELCHQPDLQGLEGIFISPLSTSSYDKLFPLFGGSKLSVNNEILLPAPMYWSEEERFTGGDYRGIPWAEKESKLIWRGVATGGRNMANNWRGFQRHRFAAMNNASTVARVEHGETPENFALPEESYSVRAQADEKLGDWVGDWSDVGVVNLACEPSQENGSCAYTEHYFSLVDSVDMAEQFDYKYLPDIDGNSFSGRYLAFLRSTSLPIKATVWREWHDSRLVAWKHFVPMDNRFGDFYGLMDYFVGYGDDKGHDEAAEKIASDGKEWAETVLRKEDMQIYVLRLLLEYARVTDERRESMGWVDDFLQDPSLEGTWRDWFW